MASMIQASTSAIAADVSESRPITECVMPRSFRMRAMIGNAVMDIADAMNSANVGKPTPCGANCS